MASAQRPVKGILKTSSSFDRDGAIEKKQHAKWDEMNILATYHPADKDYGHKKIDEPPTPYSKYEDSEGECDSKADAINPESIAKRLESGTEPTVLQEEVYEEEEEDEDETPEEKAKREAFEQKRKLHYNEFYAVKLAKQLMDEDDDEEDDDDNAKTDKKLNKVSK